MTVTTSRRVRVTKIYGFHVVEIWSVPAQQWIAQGEWLTREEALSDAASFMTYDVLRLA